MSPEAYWYVLAASLAGGLTGAIVLWNRDRPGSPQQRAVRRLVVAIVGTGAMACARLAFRKAFGPDALVNAPIAVILLTAWVAVLATTVDLPFPEPIRRVRSWEPPWLRAPWSGVPAFGRLLQRTPLRHLGGRVYLSRSLRDPAAVVRGILAAEKLHFWAVAASLPWFLSWWMDRQWNWILAAAAVHLPLNIYPILHLRLADWRVSRFRARTLRATTAG